VRRTIGATARSGGSARYVATRLVHGLFVILGAYTLTFLILDVIPGDPVRLMLSQGGSEAFVSDDQVAQLSAQYGFDKPLVVQYFDHLWQLLQGDMGRSVQNGADVTLLIFRALPSTAELAAGAVVFGVVFGALIGFVATFVRRPFLRDALLSIPSIGGSIPTFWLGLILIELFSFRFGIFPAFGNAGFKSFVLPCVTLGVPAAAHIGQVFARSLLDTLQQPYVGTAVAKGASRLRVHLVHVTRNAMLPAITVAGVVSGRLIAGAVIVETIFGRIGLGSLTVNAVQTKDLAVVQGVVILTAAVYAVVSLLVDISYRLLDPRLSAATS
jgi:peptide/nickel transport system permease protein